jgi:beta-glucosidase
MTHTRHAISLAALAVALLAGHAIAAPVTPEARAAALVARMTPDEKIALVHGHFPMFTKDKPAGMTLHAGYIPGIPRLGIPDLQESDASLGVANAGRGPKDDATALPSGLALAATFDPKIAYAGGAMIGKEARQKGYNILLAGGVNLVREPRNGRNFEYLGEDPLLAGTLAGASIKGIQSNPIVSTIKHYALNAQETGRHVVNAVIDPAALQESDLLAFHIAIEAGRPGSVMCAYNKVNGAYACENGPLFDILKTDWGYKGWVMSDWGAVHSAEAALTGLDQESGQELDKQVYFDAPLKADLASGKIPMARLDAMATRIVYGLAANGVLDHPVVAGVLDTAADGAVAQRAAESAIVLLKNTGDVLPLAKTARTILVVGGHADIGVLSGGGSSQVVPVGSTKFKPPSWAPSWGGGMIYHPSSPLAAIRARAGGATVTFDAGTDPVATAAAAAKADLVIVFATQWATEGSDVSLTLPDGQDALIASVAAANPKTVVVLETGGPVLTPWIDKPAAVLEAWYPGGRGGQAIARVLFG